MREGRHGRDRRAGAARGRAPCENSRLRDRLRRGGVDRAAPALVVDRGEVDADHVVEVDPRHRLLPAGHRAADAEPERQQHLLAARRRGGRARRRCARARRGRRAPRRSRPRAPRPRRPRPGRRRRAGRPRRSGRAGGRSSRPPRRRSAPSGAARRRACRRRGCACRSRATPGCGAALSSFQRWAMSSPARCTTASRPASASAGAGPARWRSQPSVRRVAAAEDGDLVAALRELVDEQRADAAGAAGDGDALHARVRRGSRRIAPNSCVSPGA